MTHCARNKSRSQASLSVKIRDLNRWAHHQVREEEKKRGDGLGWGGGGTGMG